MKLRKFYKLSSLLAIVPVIVFLCFMAQPVLAAEEATPKEVLTEELPPGEVGEGETAWDRWMFIADFQAFFTTSDVSGSGSTEGANLSGLFAPVYQFNDRTFFILMYDGQYYEKREFYSDEGDIGSRERVEFQSHSFTPMVRFDFGDRTQYSLTPSVFYTFTKNKDASGAGWSDGLYNYEDLGAGLDFDMRGVYDDPGTLSVGAQYYHREYDNYASLLSLTGLDLVDDPDAEKAEKDYDGIIGKVGYTWIKPVGFSWEVEYSLLHKMLDDKKVVNSEGSTQNGEEQEDDLHSLDLNFDYMMDVGGGLNLGLDLNGSMYDSNQNYWDEDRPGTGAGVDARKFTSDYYDYDSYRIRPSISYTFPLFPLTTTVSFAYQETEYDERKAETSTGDYKAEAHEETREETTLRLKYELTENWSLIGQFEYIEQRSNNEDERTYRYNYSANNVSLGVAFKY